MTRFEGLGRAEHLATLEGYADAARGGEHLVVVVEGEAGAGKSAILDAFEERLRADGDLDVRRASAYPETATSPGRIAEMLELERLDADSPTALLVDEAQWIDPTSLTRLRGIALRDAGAGLLLVVTHRPLEARSAAGLRRLVEASARRDRLHRLALGRIGVNDLAAHVAGPDAQEVTGRLVAISGGVATELDALIERLVADGAIERQGDVIVARTPVSEWAAPPSIHERVGELASDERLVVRAAAVAGHPLTLPVVAALLGRDADDALDVAERLVDAGLLAEKPEGFHPRSLADAESLSAELGEVRKVRIFERLAEAMSEAGAREREPGLVGLHYLRAQRWEDALGLLADAGLTAATQNALAEALPLVSGAIEAQDRLTERDDELAGRLRFARARCHRMLGRSDLAAEDLEEATRLLTGADRVRAHGWKAQIADDEQRATEGEWLTALAELEAARLDDQANRGVMLTLRAKMLGRLGLPEEADACLVRGIRLLRHHGDPYLHFFGHWNGAWLYFDRGQMRLAESGFEYCVDRARDFDGEEWLADARAWWSRTLFWTGRVREALDAYDSARDTADRADSQGPLFLTALGRAEGMILLGRYDDALAEAEETLHHVERLGLAWENVARYLLAAAHLGAGRLDEALADAERAVAACPAGPDGQRWRAACEALLLEVRGARGEPWDGVEAARLSRTLLAGRWLAPASRLLAVRAQHEEDPRLGNWAVALALEVGIPMLAARGLAAADLWDQPIAAAAVESILAVGDTLPDEWREPWEALPEVAPAREVELGDVAGRQEATAALRSSLEEVLALAAMDPSDLRLGPNEWTARLARAEVVTSTRKRTILVASIAALLLVGGGAVGAQILSPSAPPDTGSDATGTTEPEPEPPVHERLIVSDQQVVGQWTYRGGPERAGVSDRTGAPTLDGIWWEPFCTGQPVNSSPAVIGNLVLFGSDDGNVYAVDTRSGQQVWRRPTDGPVRSSPAIVRSVGEGGVAERDNLVVVGSDDGSVHAWVPRTGEPRWTFPTGGAVRSSPAIVDGVVYVTSRDGRLYALDVADGAELWRYPAEGEDALRQIDSSPAVAGDLVYFGSGEGIVYALHRTDGTVAWESRPLGAGIVSTPAVSDGIVYVASLDQNVWAFRAENGQPAGIGTYPTDAPVRSSPAIADGIIYVPSSSRLVAIDAMNTIVASYPIGSQTESSPAVAGDLVYIASDDGNLYAFDRTSPDEEPVWLFPTGRRVSTSPAVADGAIFIGSTDGCLYAAGSQPRD